jgi:hypothetical protein
VSEITLSQTEADALVVVEKNRVEDTPYPYPGIGGSVNIPLMSIDKREHFLLDINRSSINLKKVTHQLRARVAIVLLRLDIEGPPHRNPDGQELPCPHLHVYREGYGDKWAYPLSAAAFSAPTDLWATLTDFMRYCNITRPPIIQRGMFT